MKPHRFLEFSLRTDLLWIILICIVIVVAVLIVFRSHQVQTKAKGLTDKQKETLENKPVKGTEELTICNDSD